MCGFAGFLDFTFKSAKEDLVKMSKCLSHRGPDSQCDFFLNKEAYQIGLGHRRLSIIDLSSSAEQPMHYKQYSIIFNGEIYNYNELRDELISKGHKFDRHSDTEVILHAYEEWGIDSLHRFIGMFSFVIFDQEKNKIYCVRDRVGVKPFFYYWFKGLFLFGSELKSLLAHPNFEKQLNLDSVASFLQFGYVPAPNCIFSNAFKLQPGYYLDFDLNNQSYTCNQYWNVYDYYNKPKLNISLNEAVDETEKVLKKAFEYRMVSDVPVGVFLSGGYDSACVTSLLQKGRTEKLKTFTIGMSDTKLDEAVFAKNVADHLGTDHTEYYCTWKEALDIIPTLPYYYDEPFADSSAIPTMLVSKLAKQAVTVALSADAGDEIFAGYTRYNSMRSYSRKLSGIPKPIRYSVAGLMKLFNPVSVPVLGKKYSFANRYSKLSSLLKKPSIDEVLISGSKQFYGEDIGLLLKVSTKVQASAFDSKELMNNYSEDILYLMAVDFQTFLPDDILQKVDRATMSVSLEGREPFLDQHIIQWAAQLPTTYKQNNGVSKLILKEIVHRNLPRELMERPKMGFSIPIASWLENELAGLLHHYFNKNFVIQQGIFNPVEIERIKKAFLNGRQERAEKVWCILMFQMWYEKWMM